MRDPSGILLREAKRDDLADILRLLTDDDLGRGREAADIARYQSAFDRMETQQGNVYLLAQSDDRVVGCLQYTVIHGLSRAGASRAQIEGVRVDSAYRGAGIGEALFRHAISLAISDGCTLVQLTTDVRRPDAKRFYERLGFVPSHIGMKLALTPSLNAVE